MRGERRARRVLADGGGGGGGREEDGGGRAQVLLLSLWPVWFSINAPLSGPPPETQISCAYHNSSSLLLFLCLIQSSVIFSPLVLLELLRHNTMFKTEQREIRRTLPQFGHPASCLSHMVAHSAANGNNCRHFRLFERNLSDHLPGVPRLPRPLQQYSHLASRN